MPNPNLEVLKKETYIKAIENSVGSRIFNSLFVRAKDTGEVQDVLDDGKFSCAYFVSGLLSLFQLMDRPHSTVATVKKLLSEHPLWKEVPIDSIEAGDVIFWERIQFEDGSSFAHAGFALNSTDAVSTFYKDKMVRQHPISNQKVEQVFRLKNETEVISK